jgi:hypothetical protein
LADLYASGVGAVPEVKKHYQDKDVEPKIHFRWQSFGLVLLVFERKM